MMKSGLRKIVVNILTYFWRLGKNNCDGDGGNHLKIFLNKELFYSKVISGGINITPSFVKDIIVGLK